jgi:hypothetical protein
MIETMRNTLVASPLIEVTDDNANASQIPGPSRSGSVQTQATVDLATNWMLNSGAQVTGNDSQTNGGYVSWYEADTQSYPYVYSEISGYMLTMLTVLYHRYNDVRYLQSAMRTGDWFLATAHEPTGGFRCLFPLRDTRFNYKFNQIYAFDCGVILSGLANLYRASGQAQYLTAATTVADWLVRDVQKPNTGFRPVYDIATASFPESDKEWSLCSGSYHTKIAIGLLNLYDLTHQPSYLRGALNACDFALTFQEKSGRFISFPGTSGGGTNAHPHLYSAEGLWVVGKYLGRDDYLRASASATQWLLDLQNDAGLVPRHFQNNEPFYIERVDVLAQALRMAAIHTAEGRLSTSVLSHLEKLVPIIKRNQSVSADTRANGGFFFGRLSDGQVMPHVNVWVTMFAVQALLAYSDLQHGTLNFRPFDMV